MPTIRQTNFSGGELSPLLWGRTDLEIFGRGLRHCLNFFVTKQGAAVSRPGTQFVAEVKDGSGADIRLIPFIYSDEQSYVLEFGPSYIRFHSNGAPVQGATEFRLDYVSQSLNFTVGQVVSGGQSGATATIAADSDYGDHGTLTLQTIVGTFVDGEALGDPFLGDGYASGAVYGAPLEVVTTYVAADLPRLQWAQSGDVLTITHPSHPPRELRRTSHTSWAIADINFVRPVGYAAAYLKATHSDALALGTEDSTHPAREWAWAVSALWKDAAGVVTESARFVITQSATNAAGSGAAAVPERVAVYSDKTVTVFLPTAQLTTPSGYTAIGSRIYRGRGGFFGWVGDGATGIETFTDVGQEPDYAIAPPQGLNPFAGANYPASVAYFEERRVFAGPTNHPGFLYFSATGDYVNFDERLVPVDSQALVYELACRRREEIRWLVGAGTLLIGTNASAWSFGGSGEPLSPASVEARVQVEVGSTFLPPLVVDGAVLFARSKGQGVRSLVASNERGGFVSSDLSSVAAHMFVGETRDEFSPGTGEYNLEASNNSSLVDWAYAEDPWGMVWAVRDDGVLLSLTYSQETGAAAWARHETDGYVKNVCVIPEGDEDAVYLLVSREISFSGVLSGAVTRYYIEKMASRVRKGGPYDDAAVDCAVTVEVETGGEVAPSNVIAGLDHLQGKEVYVVAYGKHPQGPYTVDSNGTITIDEMPTTVFRNEAGTYVVILHIGLLFTPELETLDVASDSVRMKQKTVTSVGFEVDQSVGLSVGPDFDNLTPWRQRSVADNYSAISAATELVRMPIKGRWDEVARAAIRQTLPLPVTILGLNRELDIGS